MDAMPRLRPPYAYNEKNRHGKRGWVFRRDKKSPRIPLPGVYGSHEWLEAYNAALAGNVISKAGKASSGTLGWLIERYKDGAAFAALKPSSQAQRRNVLSAVAKTGGDIPYSKIDRKMVAAGRDRRAETPGAAANYVKAMSALFNWAVDAGFCEDNPAKNVRKPVSKTGGFTPWSESDVVKFISRHPLGTMPNLAITLILFTGLSRGDVRQVGWQHVRDGVLEWKRDKTGVPQFIPLLPPVVKALDALPRRNLAFLTTSHGHPFKSSASFGNWFADRCVEAGVETRAHGLRKLSSRMMAERGGTHSQLKAVYGWKSDEMASYYVGNAAQRSLAVQGGILLENHPLSPHFAKGAGKIENNTNKSKG